jgi:hypothetical protein
MQLGRPFLSESGRIRSKRSAGTQGEESPDPIWTNLAYGDALVVAGRRTSVLATWHIRSQNSSLRLLLLAICLARETREREKQGFSSRSSREKPQAYETIRRLENVLRKDMPKMGQRASTGIFAHSSVSDHCPVDSV